MEFSPLEIIKNNYRSRITNEILLRIAVAKENAEIDKVMEKTYRFQTFTSTIK